MLALGLLLGAPAGALAQPPGSAYEDQSVYDDHYESVAGEPIASVEVFYDQLSPYGVWLNDPYLGRVFTPVSSRFVPYSDGHWQYTSVGFVWISSEPFAWATSHYGRWAYSRAFDRWVWLPDTVWGPSWVEWRIADDDFGWAPLAPEIAIQVGYTLPVESWHYCPAARVLDVNVTRYYEPRQRVVEIHRAARPIEHYATIGGTRVVVGPSATTLRERHVAARPVRVSPHTVGRWTATEVQTAARRAQDRRATNEEQNRRRIESNASLRQAQAKVAVTTPGRPAGNPSTSQPQPRPPTGQAQPQPPTAQPQPQPPMTQRPSTAPAAKPEPRPEPKQETRPNPAPQRETPRPEPKQETRPNPPPQREPTRPEPKQETRPNPPPQRETPRPEPKQETRPNPPPQRETPRPEPKQETRPKEPRQPTAKENRAPERKQPEAKKPERREPQTPPRKPDGE
jgi:hypothetical protein